MSPRPPRGDTWICPTCNGENEPDRTTCINTNRPDKHPQEGGQG